MLDNLIAGDVAMPAHAFTVAQSSSAIFVTTILLRRASLTANCLIVLLFVGSHHRCTRLCHDQLERARFLAPFLLVVRLDEAVVETKSMPPTETGLVIWLTQNQGISTRRSPPDADSIVVTERDQVAHAVAAHIAEHHRRAGRVLGSVR
jgi:hypothetical protein